MQRPEIERLITRLEARTACTPADPSSLAQLEEALTRGCLTALTNDARCRRLTERLNNLDRPLAADEALRLADERRTLEDSTRLLRVRLGAARAAFERAVSARACSA